MKKFVPVLSIILGILCIAIGAKSNAESFSYIDFKVGSFLDACHIDTCTEPDGKLPAYAAVGHEWALHRQWSASIEFQHRSNLDIGWPVKGETGTEEYDRNGVFGKVRYRFNFND